MAPPLQFNQATDWRSKMKAQYKILGMVIASLISAIAFADSDIKKPSTRIDFNKMIDQNNNEKDDLQKVTAAKGSDESQQQEQTASDDKKKVMDFVDVEVGMGQARPVVDRRFNSVGQARVEKSMSLQLVKVNNAKETVN